MNIARLMARGAATLSILLAGSVAAFAQATVERQPTNWTAIAMFAVFVAGTLFITKWAASKTKSASDFYTAGGGITGFYVRRANSEFDAMTRDIVKEAGK